MAHIVLGVMLLLITAGASYELKKPPVAAVVAVLATAVLASTLHSPQWTTFDVVVAAVPWALAGDFAGAYYASRRWQT